MKKRILYPRIDFLWLVCAHSNQGLVSALNIRTSEHLYIREFNMKEDRLCNMLCVYMCVHRYLYFGICCRQEVGLDSSLAVKTLTAPIGFLLEMSFMMSNWYVFAYMHMIDYTCFLLWLLVVRLTLAREHFHIGPVCGINDTIALVGW